MFTIEERIERQESIEFLYKMLRGHRHLYNVKVLSSIDDDTSAEEIYILADEAYKKPMQGKKAISRELAQRYVRRFGGRITGYINHPDSYPYLKNKWDDSIGIILE